MDSSRRKILYIILLVFGVVLTVASLINMMNPTIKYVEYTDEEIKQRARELGMVELKEVIELDKEKKADEKTNTEENTKQELEKTQEKDTKIVTETKLNEEVIEEDNGDGAQKTLESGKQSEEYIEFKIHKGEKSEDIISRLFKLGIIDDKEKFTEVVVSKKAGRDFVFGTFKVKKGMDYERLIKILTGR
jgi:hypothetical protein